MTAKEQLLELIGDLPEAKAERLLPIVEREVERPAPGSSNIGRILELMEQWEKEDAEMDPTELERIHHALDNIEPVRFREFDAE